MPPFSSRLRPRNLLERPYAACSTCRGGVRKGLALDATDEQAAYVQAFSRMPVPALLIDDVRLVAANEAADRLLAALEEPAAALRLVRSLMTRRGGRGTFFQAGSADFRMIATPLSTSSRLRLCLLFRSSRPADSDPYERWALTPPERRVAACLERGSRNQQIAVVLGLSVETVRKHVAHIFKKTGVETRAAFVALVLRPSSELDSG